MVAKEGRELARREAAYRKNRPPRRRSHDVVCATMLFPFRAVGASYWDFTQVTDEEVRTPPRWERMAS